MRRLKRWFHYWLYRQMRVRYGPFMFSQGWGDEWMFVDHLGNIYVIRYDSRAAYEHVSPLVVTLFKAAP